VPDRPDPAGELSAVPSAGPGVAETHSALVFFVGDRAYKLKKPIDLGFLDFRTPEARRAACHREVELNRRLAPDVYLGVADVLGVDGRACDHLVVMRRMPSERRLSTLVHQGADVDAQLWELAHLVAAFHGRAEHSAAADEAASVTATRERWRTNTEEMRLLTDGGLDPELVERVQDLADAYLDGRDRLFAARVADGRAMDGHGDLLADDIFCLPDGPRVLDCLEFDDRLRMGDGLADAAFLAMDLERLGRADLGQRFLEHYAEHAGDAWPASLAHHQVAYRAQVRAKVSAIRAVQGDAGAAGAAAALLAIAAAHLDAGRVRLLLVGGLPGTGKSSLAGALGHGLGATVLRSDEIRKERAGLATDQAAPAAYGAGLYTDEATTATYQTMLEWAAAALAMGETVVLDASWTSARWREQARTIAATSHAEVVELRCDAPTDVAAARMARRAAKGVDPSDATPLIAARMAAHADPWPEATTITTAQDRAHTLADALAVIG
jgi:aminoglycoside phosphotransferase family enzyme/predicted kinase